MSKKERVEDLGRLAVKITDIYEHDLFDIFGNWRTKDSWDMFSGLSEDQKIEFIRDVAYGLQDVRSKLSWCIEIAEGDAE